MAHRKFLDIFVLSALMVALFSGPTAAPAQVSISIGAAPVCPYGYYDYAPYSCSPYGYYGPDWFSGGSSLERAPGITVLAASMATSTIAMILDMVTPDRCPHAGSRRSTTSTPTRHGITRAT
jgi:hypothetical protein